MRAQAFLYSGVVRALPKGVYANGEKFRAPLKKGGKTFTGPSRTTSAGAAVDVVAFQAGEFPGPGKRRELPQWVYR